MNIPFLSLSPSHALIKSDILVAFENFFDSGWYVLGSEVKDFEAAYADFNQTKFCIGVSNGLDALHMALKALDIGPGDEVILPSNTYIATALAVSYVGATPVFAEPDIQTYNLNPDNIEALITPSTRAIMPVHLYGQACNMAAVMDIARKHGLYVVEDNAQSQGASWAGKFTGSWGNVNGTSFYPGKNLGALGDAGAVTTDSEELAEKIAVLRNYGSRTKYYNEVIGHNMRLDECQAAFLRIKLAHLPDWTKQRQVIANWYEELLGGIPDLILPFVAGEATHVYHLYVVRHAHRDRLQQHLSAKSIGTLIHYPVPPHLQEAYASMGYKKGDFPIAEEIANTCLSLPIWPGMTRSMVEEIATAIREFKA